MPSPTTLHHRATTALLAALALSLAAFFVVLGTTSASSQVSELTEREKDRIGGADRFETAALVAQRAFPDGAESVYLARADNPADALAAGALPDGPILLVPSTGELPAAVADAIEALDPQSVVAIGGTSAIEERMLDQASGRAPIGGGPSSEVIDVRRDFPVEPQAGTWQVGEAGTVTFALDDGALSLIDVAASDGWSASVDEDNREEIEVDFERGDVEYTIEVEWDGVELEIEIDQDLDDAEPGRYELGQAGAVEVALESGRLTLVNVDVATGWRETDRDVESDDIDVELSAGPEQWEFSADLDDGELDIELDYEVSGPPAS